MHRDFGRLRPGQRRTQSTRPPDIRQITILNGPQGRILQCYQIIFISEGSGVFESEHTHEPQAVKSGSVLILFPGVWHRYAPDRRYGLD